MLSRTAIHLIDSLPVTPAQGGTGITSYATGDLLQASASTTLAKLAAVATGNVLISGGVTTVSSWGKVGLTTHVSGILPPANGGTGVDNGSFTLTVPATGTAALLGTANTFTQTNGFAAITATDAEIGTLAGSEILRVGGSVKFSGAFIGVGALAATNIATLTNSSATGYGPAITAGTGTTYYCMRWDDYLGATPLMRLNGNGQLVLHATTASTSTTTGALIVAGGAGFGNKISLVSAVPGSFADLAAVQTWLASVFT